MKETFVNSPEKTTKKWYVFDAEDQILGRLATKATNVLMGKNKNTYTPYLDRPCVLSFTPPLSNVARIIW